MSDPSASEGTWTYLAVEPCGCVTGAAVDMVAHADDFNASYTKATKSVAQDVKQLERHGRTVERRWIPRGELPLVNWPDDCPHKSEQSSLITRGAER